MSCVGFYLVFNIYVLNFFNISILNNIIEVILSLFNLIYNYYFYVDQELAHLTHDLDDLSSSLHIETHIINELS